MFNSTTCIFVHPNLLCFRSLSFLFHFACYVLSTLLHRTPCKLVSFTSVGTTLYVVLLPHGKLSPLPPRWPGALYNVCSTYYFMVFFYYMNDALFMVSLYLGELYYVYYRNDLQLALKWHPLMNITLLQTFTHDMTSWFWKIT